MMAAIVDKNGVSPWPMSLQLRHTSARRTKTAYPAMEGVLRRDQPQADHGSLSGHASRQRGWEPPSRYVGI